MRVACPRCGGRISRNLSPNPSEFPLFRGLMWDMVFSAFAAPECYRCGKIPMVEFSQSARLKLRLASAAVIGIAVALAIGLWKLMR